MQNVLRVVTRAANLGGAMPNNPLLGHMAGGHGRSSALRALRRLAVACIVHIEVQGSYRRVLIVQTNRWTDWGDAPPRTRPLPPPPPRRSRTGDLPETRAPESRPLPAARDSTRTAVGPIAPATTCQYPLWADGERPGESPLFCGDPSTYRSLCGTHAELCYVPGKAPFYGSGTMHGRARNTGRVYEGRVFNRLEDGQDAPGNRIYTTEALFG